MDTTPPGRRPTPAPGGDPQPGLARSMLRGVRLRCPCCGVGRLFRTWFDMHPRCGGCGLAFVVEPGTYVGAIYVNYGVTAVLALLGVFAFPFWFDLPPPVEYGSLVGFGVAFPVAFFPVSRGLWLGFLYGLDPWEEESHP